MTTPRIGSAAGEAALSGWALFSAIVLVVAGSFNIINGATAIHRGSYYADKLLFGDLTGWGWVVLIVGILQAVAGFLVFSRNRRGTSSASCSPGRRCSSGSSSCSRRRSPA